MADRRRRSTWRGVGAASAAAAVGELWPPAVSDSYETRTDMKTHSSSEMYVMSAGAGRLLSSRGGGVEGTYVPHCAVSPQYHTIRTATNRSKAARHRTDIKQHRVKVTIRSHEVLRDKLKEGCVLEVHHGSPVL